MAIGDRVRQAEEERLEQQLNSEGKLSGRQLKALVAKGMPLGDARELFQSGIPYADIAEIADTQMAFAQSAKQGTDIAELASQNRAFMEKVLEKARNRRPESYNGDFEYHNKSWRSPDGSPIPDLVCKMFEGTWRQNDRTRLIEITDGYELEDTQLTKTETRLVNRLQPGEYTIENRDGERGILRIVVDLNPATGTPTKMTIAYPFHWYTKDGKQKKPGIIETCRQVLGIEGPLEAWLDAQEMVAA